MRVMARAPQGGTIWLHYRAEPKGRRQRMLAPTFTELLDYGLLSGLQAQSEISELLEALLRRPELGPQAGGRAGVPH
jgi:hypothetical protein